MRAGVARGIDSADLRAALLPAVPLIVEAAITAISRRGNEDPAARRALERNLRIGLNDAVDGWFGGAPRPGSGELHAALGRAQARAGRSLEELMTFYRIAGQTMWRRLTELADSDGVQAREVYRLAETGFGCVEELSSCAAAGFTDEQAHRSGASRARRSELVRSLLRDPQPPAEDLVEAALALGVTLAPTVAVFVADDVHHDAFVRAAGDLLTGEPHEGRFAGVLVDALGPRRQRQLELAAERSGALVALGPTVAVAHARASLAQARILLTLARESRVRVDGARLLVRAADHELAILLAGQPLLARAFASRRLAPLDAARGEQTRAQLRATLRAWLAHHGSRKAVAHELHVHPQTVSYRMRTLHSLFGDALDQPHARLELALALEIGAYAEERPPARVAEPALPA